MRKISLPGGTQVPVLGQGTWMMGEDPGRRSSEVRALQRGIDLGMTLIDTAEMYGEGASEERVAEAVRGRRDEVFLVTKAFPQNASKRRLPEACERSLGRLATDYLDLYLLHWRGSVPLGETVEAMEALRQAGKIRHWGVSNLDVDDLAALFEAGGQGCVTNQILYNLTRRGPEFDLLPFLGDRAMPAMAYSPIEQGRLHGNSQLMRIAKRHHASSTQVALAWVLRRDDILAIPKAGTLEHLEENAKALELKLTQEDLTELDQIFPAPGSKRRLEML